MDIDNYTDPAACEISKSLSQNISLKAMLMLELILGLSGILPTTLLIVAVSQIRIFHPNLRVLLLHTAFILLWCAVSSAIKPTLTIFSLYFRHPCFAVISRLNCAIRELPSVVPQILITYASLATCLERLYATVKYRTYDTNSAKPWLAFILMPICWTVTLLPFLSDLLTIQKKPAVPICEDILTRTPQFVGASLAVVLTLETLIVMLSIALRLYNKKQLHDGVLRRENQNLSSRFQLEQNTHINRMVTPSMVFQAACFIPGLLFMAFLAVGMDLSFQTKVIMMNIAYLWRQTFVIVCPLFGFACNQPLNTRFHQMTVARAMQRVLQQFKVVSIDDEPAPRQPNGVEAGNQHFGMLDRMWNTDASGVWKR